LQEDENGLAEARRLYRRFGAIGHVRGLETELGVEV
jgi:hypothetical protein